MKESVKTTIMNLDVIDSNGEIQSMLATQVNAQKYYNITKLTTRINNMDFTDIQANICRSSRDIRLLGELLDLQGSDGRIRLVITSFAQKHSVTRLVVDNITKRSLEHDLFKKEDRGVYFINPYVFIGRKIRSNQQRESLQVEWKN